MHQNQAKEAAEAPAKQTRANVKRPYQYFVVASPIGAIGATQVKRFGSKPELTAGLASEEFKGKDVMVIRGYEMAVRSRGFVVN